MDNIIQFLMDGDEVQDALTAYHIDPTDENKRRVIETFINEFESGKRTLALPETQPAVKPKPVHRYVLIPNVVTIYKDVVDRSSAKGIPSIHSEIDADRKSIAALARRAADHIHELGGSAVYVRFDFDEWTALFEDEGHVRTINMFNNIQEYDDLDVIADVLNTFIARLGNVDSPEYAAKLLRKMYAVAQGQIDDTIGKALIRMVDTTMTQNMPLNCKDQPEEDENEDE